MAIILSNVSNALKKVILPYIQDNYTKAHPLLDQIRRDADVTFINNNFYAPVRSSRHGGIVNLANDGSKLVSSKASIGLPYVGVKIITGTFDISKLTLDATKTKEGAVENQLSFQAKTLTSDFSKDLNRQYYSDGLGVVSQVSSSADTTVWVGMLPDAAGGGTNDTRLKDVYGTVNGDISPTEYIFAGQALTFGSVGTANGTVSSVGSDGTVTMTATLNADVAGSLAVYRIDGDLANGGTAEIHGIRDALSSTTGTSTYAAYARSNPGWTPQIGTTSEVLTLSAMQLKYLNAKKWGQAGDRYAIFTNLSLYNKYGNILTALRRTVNETDLLGGWTGLEFAAGAGRVGVFLDYDVPDGEVIILNLDSWTVCQVSDLDWMEDTNALVRRTDYLTYQATMVWFMNLLCRCPAANGRLTQKTD